MGCNSCRSACEDCSEGGIIFRRSRRPALPVVRPTAVFGAKPPSSVDGGRAVAEMGSDPNSASHAIDSQRSFPELGSDPNSAGHKDIGSSMFSASSPYKKSDDSYLININSSLDPINGPCAETRRMGVRAQFGDVSATNLTTVGRIGKTPSPGIRPQICYAAREFEAGLKSRLIDDAVVPLTPGAAA